MKSVLSFVAGAITFVLSQSAGVLALLPHGVAAVLPIVGAALTAFGIRSASSVPPTVTALLDLLGSKWKTIVGIVAALVGALASPDVANLLPAAAAHVVVTAGAVLTALGLYHAQAATAPSAFKGT